MFRRILVMLHSTIYFIFLIQYCFGGSDIQNLEGNADFKSVQLHWKYSNELPEPLAFLIKYCEDQAWGSNRCKTKEINKPWEYEILSATESKKYEVTLTGLKMFTNYTIRVSPITSVSGSTADRGRSIENVIMVKTKGFSAKATKCLANSSVVEINTGPYFGGKISVEFSEDPECTTQGDPKSPKTSYLLKIDHDICGSEIVNASVKTYIIVQENVPILTHSTRRYMVVCTYVPETFTVRAGVNLPDYDESSELENVDRSVNEVDPSELFDSSNNLFDSGITGDIGRALKLSASNTTDRKPQMWAHLVLMVILVISAIIGLSCAVWHFVRQSYNRNGRGLLSSRTGPSLPDSEEIDISDIQDSNLESLPNLVNPNFGPIATPLGESNPVALDILYDNIDPNLHHTMLCNTLHKPLYGTDIDPFTENAMTNDFSCINSQLTNDSRFIPQQMGAFTTDINNPDDLTIVAQPVISCITETHDQIFVTDAFHPYGPNHLIQALPFYDEDSLSFCSSIEDIDDPYTVTNDALNPNFVNLGYMTNEEYYTPSAIPHMTSRSNYNLASEFNSFPFPCNYADKTIIDLENMEFSGSKSINFPIRSSLTESEAMLASLKFDTIQMDLDDLDGLDDEVIDDDVFVTETDDELANSNVSDSLQVNKSESNWKLGDGKGKIVPAKSV